MYLKDLKKQIDKIDRGVLCDGPSGTGSHYKTSRHPTDYVFPPNVIVKQECGEETKYFKIANIEPTINPGCGCWDGIRISLEEDK